MKKDLTREKILAALEDSSTLTEAAQKAGISRKTLYTYIRNDIAFAREFKARQEQTALEEMESAQANRRKAYETILAIMDDAEQPGAIRLRAAQTLLDGSNTAQKRVDAIVMRNVEANNNPFQLLGRED